MNVDPITFAVIKSGLDSIADDMAYTVVRIARSEIVKDVMDFSAAICAGDGQMVAQAKTIAQHLGAIPEAMEAVLSKFGDDLHEGDVVIMNDPYHGGMHLPDIFMFVPIFFENKRRAFAVVICHHTDVGGRVPGSNASDSTEIYQEGLRIPPLKLYERGVLNDDARDADQDQRTRARPGLGRFVGPVCCRPGRAPRPREADAALRPRRGRRLHAGAARLCRAHDTRRDQDLAERHLPLHRLHRQRRLLRRADPDQGRDHGARRWHLAASTTPAPLPQVKGALNSTLSFTHSLTYLSVRCVLARDVPNNVGMFRCVKVIVPEASMLNPVMPAPCAARALTGYRVFDTMLGALSQIVPDKVPAAGEGGNSVICISGLRPNRKPFIIVDMICGAWGGRPDKDGLEAVTNASQNLSNMPVEVMEAEHPVRIEDYAFVPDSCGPGKWRGGVGIRRSYRILAPEALLQMRTDRVALPPYGLAGGGPAGRRATTCRPAARRCRCRARSPQRGEGYCHRARAGRRRRLRQSVAPPRRHRRGRRGRQDHAAVRARATTPSSLTRRARGCRSRRQRAREAQTGGHGGSHAGERARNGAIARSAAAQATRAAHPRTARDEFVTDGLNGARVDRIAERAGVNKNLIYHYFGSKDGSTWSVLERIYAGLRASQDDARLRALPPWRACASWSPTPSTTSSPRRISSG